LPRATAGVVGETIFSTLMAFAHALAYAFCRHQPARISVSWTTQNVPPMHDLALRRATDWGHMLIGAIWGAFMWRLDPTLFWWFTPVLAGLVLSIPLSVLTSRPQFRRARASARIISHAGRN